MYKDESIQKLKEAMNIKEIIGTAVKLKKSGSDFEACCPFHSERTPSFKVSPAKGIFKCFGCGRQGDAIAFVMEHNKISYIDAIKAIAVQMNFDLEEEGGEKSVIEKPVPRLEKLGKKALTFFEEKRKISNNTLLRFKVSETTEWMHQSKTEELVICFNYLRDGELINIKFRGPGKSFKMSKNAELIFYNLDAIKGEKSCVIVEGEVDCLSMHEAGIYNSISVPNGAGLTGNAKLEYLDNCYEYFLPMEKIVIATDNDPAGKKLRDELARRLGKDRCFQVEWPEGCKDANDVLVKCSPEELLAMVETAKQWPVEGLLSMADVEAEVDDFYENGYPKGLRAHIPGFDELLTFMPGQLTVITGSPGSGKSEFVDWLITSLSRMHGITWGICSFETTVPFHITKLAEKYTDKSFAFRKNKDDRMTQSQYDYSKKQILKNFLFMNISLIDITMDGLLAKAEEMVKSKGITGLLFDPWNCIEHKYGEESETKYVLTCLNKLIHFLDKYQVHGFLVAHPVKLGKDKKTGKTSVPTLYDISGSAHFFNRTHNGIVVDRNKATGQVEIYVQKVKYSWLGHLGFTSFYFNENTRTYSLISETSGSNGNGLPIELGPGSWKPTEIDEFENQQTLPYADN